MDLRPGAPHGRHRAQGRGRGRRGLAADDEGSLNIALSSPFGDALFEVPLSPLADFLHRTYQAVRRGKTEFIDIDAELENLLWPS